MTSRATSTNIYIWAMAFILILFIAYISYRSVKEGLATSDTRVKLAQSAVVAPPPVAPPPVAPPVPVPVEARIPVEAPPVPVETPPVPIEAPPPVFIDPADKAGTFPNPVEQTTAFSTAPVERPIPPIVGKTKPNTRPVIPASYTILGSSEIPNVSTIISDLSKQYDAEAATLTGAIEKAAADRQAAALKAAAEQAAAARLAAEQAAAARLAAEQEAARLAAEQAAAARLAAEQEAARVAAEQEAARVAADERLAAEREAARVAAWQAAALARYAAEQEAATLAAEQAAAAMLAAEQAAAARLAAQQEAARLAREITACERRGDNLCGSRYRHADGRYYDYPYVNNDYNRR
jgi:hypothetical protein